MNATIAARTPARNQVETLVERGCSDATWPRTRSCCWKSRTSWRNSCRRPVILVRAIQSFLAGSTRCEPCPQGVWAGFAAWWRPRPKPDVAYLSQLPDDAVCGAPENSHGRPDTNLDLVVVENVRDLDLVVVENADSHVVQNVRQLGGNIDQPSLAD